MKDYSTNEEEAKRFILNYEIDDNQIKVNLANGESYPVPYTLENETGLNNWMRNQVINAIPYFASLKVKICTTRLKTIFCALMLLLNIVLLLVGTSFPFLTYLCIGWFSLSTTIEALEMIYVSKKVEDLRKNFFFLKNEEEFIEGVRESSEVLESANDQVKEIITSRDNRDINFNTIDKIKYQELKRILQNIRNSRDINFSDSQEEYERSR